MKNTKKGLRGQWGWHKIIYDYLPARWGLARGRRGRFTIYYLRSSQQPSNNLTI
ncbi:MAG TPA: hypothetical protein VFG54_15255 [Prolixibacteraceae bacterium]|nr:hypothetical protein [Prolixibacteraceae bacterium]